ncbi:CD209 antigen isoform X2 [Notamacropus eugenii]|uniref:CD209 antigen isoform X2 n=1 Tax=Notamacropus eugenii TaxID=9315 RepID=UPI003B6803D3
MCDTEDPKSPELAGLDEDMLMPSGWNHFNLGSQRSQSLRSFPAPWLSRLGFLMKTVFFALSFILSIVILSKVFQNQRQYNLDHEEIRKKLNQLPAQLTNDRVSQNQSQYNLEYEAILKKLNQLSAQLKDDGDLKGKGQLEVSQLMEQLNKTLSSLCRPCPCDWKFYKDSCYHFSVNRKSWEVAKEMCEAEDSNLVIINSSEEQMKGFQKGQQSCEPSEFRVHTRVAYILVQCPFESSNSLLDPPSQRYSYGQAMSSMQGNDCIYWFCQIWKWSECFVKTT